MDSNQPGLSNPFSTGGGGTTFEQLVGASYLVALLAGDIPRGLDSGICVSVRFQYRWSGCVLDDIVVESSDGATRRRVALQVKHDLTFSEKDSTFLRVIEDCWSTFRGAFGWQFNPPLDRIGIGVGGYNKKLDTELQTLLDWARTSSTADEFVTKVHLPYFSSAGKREYLTAFRQALESANGTAVSDKETWHFLRCLVVLHFDLEHPGSRDSVQAWNRLLDQLQGRDAGHARVLFSVLTSLVAEHARNGGTVDAGALRNLIPAVIPVRAQAQHAQDLARLSRHSDLVLDSIRDVIGSDIRLPRAGSVEVIVEALADSEAVVIADEPMTGKSALLKLMATRLSREGLVIALSVERMFGSTIETFLHDLNIDTDLTTLLGAAGQAPHRCILIDGLERALEEARRPVLNDIIATVCRFNIRLTANGGNSDYCWKLLFTCRKLEAGEILVHLETRRLMTRGTLRFVAPGALTQAELSDVAQQLPKLAPLINQERLRALIALPFVLDILTLPEVALLPEDVPEVLSEPWLMEWFWKVVVRRSEGARSGRGSPDRREELLFRALLSSVDDSPSQAGAELDDALAGLRSDRIVRMSNQTIQFAHDVLEDWAWARMLERHRDQIPAFLAKVREPLSLTRGFRLFALHLLEIERADSAWRRLLDRLREAENLSPRWYQIALTAPLSSPRLATLLSGLEPHLLADEAALLESLLTALTTVCVAPSPSVYVVLGDLPAPELEKYLAYWTEPIIGQWLPVLKLALKYAAIASQEELIGYFLTRFAPVAEKWMKDTHGSDLLRPEIGALGLRMLMAEPAMIDSQGSAASLIKAVLWAADCMPDEVRRFVETYCLDDWSSRNSGFEELFLVEGWLPTCKFLPQTAVETIDRIISRRLEPDPRNGYSSFAMRAGLGLPGFNPPTYLRGPFLGFLRWHPREGLAAIHAVVNRATGYWVEDQRQENREPLAQSVVLKSGPVHVWGDSGVYQWYRFPSLGPDVVSSALMALERWMGEQVKKGADVPALFEEVLSGTSAAAVVAVCLAVALEHWRLCLDAAVPILEQQAFWLMDIERVVRDASAASVTTAFAQSFGLLGDTAAYNMLVELASQPHRRLDVRALVQAVMFSGSEDSRSRLVAAMKDFPTQLPFFFEHERHDSDLVKRRRTTAQMWAAMADPQNYDVVPTENAQQVAIQFRLPSELEERLRPQSAATDAFVRINSLLMWSVTLRDEGRVGPAFTVASAMELARQLAAQDNPSKRPETFQSDAEQRAWAIAAFAAGLVMHQWDWLNRENLAPWCREQVLIAARRPEPTNQIGDEIGIFPYGYRRSAARGLASLLARHPNDRTVRRAIVQLCAHPNPEVRGHLFLGLAPFWARDRRVIQKYIRVTVALAQSRGVERRYAHLAPRWRGHVIWGRGARLKRLWLRVRRASQLVGSKVRPKPIESSSAAEMDAGYLSPILLSIPSGDALAELPANEVVDLLESFLRFSVNSFLHFQRAERSYNEWAANGFNRHLFAAICEAMMSWPSQSAETRLLPPILSQWEKCPALLATFLPLLVMTGARAGREERFVELLVGIGNSVLSSNLSNVSRRYLSSDMEDILSALVLQGTGVALQGDLTRWASLDDLARFFTSWCARVGHNADCFRALVRMLRGPGFGLIPRYGTGWLFSCLTSVDDYSTFFERSQCLNVLAELLSDSWSRQAAELRKDRDTMRQFATVVDIVANQGNTLAVRLQGRIQGMT